MRDSAIEIIDGRNRIVVDVAATRRLYELLGRPSSDSCSCVECRGFVANRKLALPNKFRALLRRMGIDWTNEGDLWSVAGPRDFYISAEFDFVGDVLSPSRALTPGCDRPFDYVFKNVAGRRSIEAASDLRLGSVASVRFGALLPIKLHVGELLVDFPASRAPQLVESMESLV
jgi:hypothetical protein